MPELLEVEAYRQAALGVVGRMIDTVHAPDDWYTKGDTSPEVLGLVLPGCVITNVRRIGKLMLVDTDGPVLGMRFGMTGRLIIDGGAAIESLEYSSKRDDPAWDRFGVTFSDGSSLLIRDPRRLGGVELDPDESRLGPDAASVTYAPFRELVLASAAPLKARLMDQAKLAGLGNLLVDETRWRAGLAPSRPGRSLNDDELRRLHRTMRRTVALLGRRGGSHTGDLHPSRVRGGFCPRDGGLLCRDQIGGRTTYWCPHHQR